jgi:uncharacterized protein (DUF58 family)
MTAQGRGRQVELSWSFSAHARRLLTLALSGLAVAVITQRPAFAAAAAPAMVLLAAWRRDRPEDIRVRLQLTAIRVYENEHSAIDATLGGTADFSVELLLHAADAVEMPDRPRVARPDASRAQTAAGGTAAGAAGEDASAAGDTATSQHADTTRAALPFLVGRWGRRRIGYVEIILRDRWRLREGRVTVPLPLVDCYPAPATLDSRVVLSRLLNWLGEHASRAHGAGTDFSGVREFVPGDAQRRINWPATTRQGSLQLNMFAAERTQNVVVVVDATSDVGEIGHTSLDLALRGAAGTARAYLAARDRVGFISYASSAAWIAPGTGMRQFYRIMDAMLAESGIGAQGGLDRLPKAALPPGALIIVFSPLLDRRIVETLRDLRERGFTLLIIDVLNAVPESGTDRIAGLARRIWRMEQQAIRFSLRELGIPVVHWDGEQSLDEPLAPYTRRAVVSR